MKSFSICLAAFCLGVATLARGGEQHVILITIDGFPARMLEDPKTSVPNIRALAADGVQAKAMKVATPSVTWPNHTTLVSGVYPRKHSVLFNGVLVRGGAGGQVKIDPNKLASELVAAPTIFDLLRNAGHTTAGVNWPCTRLSKSLDDDFPDSPNMVDFTTPRLRAELAAAGIIPSEKQEDWAKLRQPQQDEAWTRTACYLIRTRMPEFMAVHLLNTDSTHHKYGPESMASYSALALADRFVGDIVNAVNAAGKRGSTTFIVTADHGFATATNVLQPNLLLRQAGLLQYSNATTITSARVQVVPEGGSGFIYLNDPASRDADRKTVTELFAGKEGVAELIGPERFAELGIPDAGTGGSPDLILRPKMGYGVVGTATGADFVVPVTPAISSGYHGYVADEPNMDAIFVASGRGIKRGANLETIRNVDVAPTVMKLLGQELPNSDGKVLNEILGRNVAIIAHRGGSYDAPENTLASFRLGYEHGADGDELDIHLTKDNQVVVMHDYDTERVGGSKKKIADSTLAELQQFNIGAWGKWTNHPFNEKIPTLAQALATVPAGKKMFIEIKTGPEIIPALEKVLAETKLTPEQTIIITFNYDSAIAAKKTFPNRKTYWLVGYAKDKTTGKFPELAETIQKANAAHVDGLDLNFNWPLTKETVGQIKAAGLECHVWTVDEPDKAREMVEAGVDSITTNRPKFLREQLGL